MVAPEMVNDTAYVGIEDENASECDSHQTREAWLQAATRELVTMYAHNGLTAPRTRVGVGFTSGGRRGKAIGECWADGASADATREIFLVPTLTRPDELLATLLHELVHASLPAGEKHGRNFRKVALACGLTGKMTATVASPVLLADLEPVIAKLGAYPHARLNIALGGKKKQTTRMLKVVCAQDTDYILRMSAKVLDMAAPLCGLCGETMALAGGDEE